MQELRAEKTFYDWLRKVSASYGDAMATWGQAVHDAVAGGGGPAPQSLLAATDAAVEGLVRLLMAIGARHDAGGQPPGGAEVLDALDRLLGASAELLRDARAGLESQGIAALAAMAPRITALRALEGAVERASGKVQDRLDATYGDPGKP